jgi:hypothetical protein
MTAFHRACPVKFQMTRKHREPRINRAGKSFLQLSRRQLALLPVRSQKVLSNDSFLHRVQENLSDTASIWETDHSHHPCATAPVESLSENRFIRIDGDTTIAFTHAVEEIALDETHGKFLAAFQHADILEARHDRYSELCRTLEEVQVIATGNLTQTPTGLKFCNDAKALFAKFWVVLYEGVRNRVMFLAEQTNDAVELRDKEFIGFYTFDQRVITQAREDVASLLGGNCPHLKNFQRLRQLDQAAKRLNVEFARENKNLELAIHKLRENDQYGSQHFIEDFDKTLQRLTALKAHLPELIGGQRNK